MPSTGASPFDRLPLAGCAVFDVGFAGILPSKCGERPIVRNSNTADRPSGTDRRICRSDEREHHIVESRGGAVAEDASSERADQPSRPPARATGVDRLRQRSGTERIARHERCR